MTSRYSTRARVRARRLQRELIERKRLALIETFAANDPELHERLSKMTYAEIVIAKNAGHLTAPELPLVNEDGDKLT